MIGYRGSGKTTVGRRLAKLLQCEFCDLDEQIETKAGMKISQIFHVSGETGFRSLESNALAAAAARSDLVVALGGGCCEAIENRRILKRTGKVVWLTSPPEMLWKRIQADPVSPETRPALSALGGLEEIKSILSQRESNYAACADYTLDSSSSNPDDLALKIASWWRTVDKS